MAIWNPWRGCHHFSEGCRFCYIHKGDSRRGIDTNQIVKTNSFYKPIDKKKNGDFSIKSGQTVYVCFSSDFLLPDADTWRADCWQMMRERSDLQFLFLTKRIERFMDCIPDDWGSGYENVTVGCTVENQELARKRLELFESLPIRHKNVICQPLIEDIEIAQYLKAVELVVVGGESDNQARPLDYNWVLSIREQCIRTNTDFEFRQCGTHFIKDGKQYKLAVRQLCSQAKKAGIDYKAPHFSQD